MLTCNFMSKITKYQVIRMLYKVKNDKIQAVKTADINQKIDLKQMCQRL